MRSLRWVIVLLVLGTAAMLFLVSRQDGPSRRAPDAPQAVDPRTSSSERGVPAAPPSAATPSREEVAPAPEQVAEAKTAELRKLTGRVIVLDPDGRAHETESGTITWLVWSDDGTGRPAETTVDQGRFDVPGAVGTKLTPSNVVLDGRAAFADAKDLVVDAAGPLELRVRWPSRTMLRVVDAETHTDLNEVQVVKARGWEHTTDEHPGEVQAEQVLVEHATSPLELQPLKEPFGTAWQDTLFARAPGYAWTRFQLDFTTGGEHRVELRRPAELEVTLLNYHAQTEGFSTQVEEQLAKIMEQFAKASPDQFPDGKKPEPEAMRQQLRQQLTESMKQKNGSGVVIRVRDITHLEIPSMDQAVKQIMAFPDSAFPGNKRPTETELRAQLERQMKEDAAGEVKVEVSPAKDGPTRITDLLPGKCIVSAEMGKSFRNPVVLAQQQVEISAGETTRVSLSLADPPRSEKPAPLAGTLYLPPDWSDLEPDLWFEILERPDLEESVRPRARFSSMQPVEGTPGLYRWSAGKVPPGKYVATIHAVEMQFPVDVPPEGNEEVRLEIGEPADVSVHLVDESGADAEVKSVHWYGERAPGKTGGGLESATYDPATRTYQFRAPAGRVVIHIWDRRFRFINETIDLDPGPNEHTIHLERSCGIILSLRDGDAKVKWPEYRYPSVESLGAEGAEAGSGDDPSGYYMAVSAPGRYRVKVPEVDGYEPVPAFEIDVAKGEFVTRNVALQRRR
jgi:hypothetical protein